MESLKILKIKIYQPQAHYRIPFTYQRRHTYPIPPYSTIIGLLCNILGIRNLEGKEEPSDQNYHKLKKIKISICGAFESKTTEWTWFRNLSKESHNSRFVYHENRYISGLLEHPGGQIPVLIDILNNVNLWIYLYHEDKNFLENIKDAFSNPKNWIYPLHLGRAEDWIVLEKVDFVEIKISDIGGSFKKFFWISKELWTDNNLQLRNDWFEKASGLLYKIPTFYKLKNGIRCFEYIDAKLNDGEIYDLKFYFDEEEKIPVFFANLGG
ncbi:MAG: type I-B CRISPR-associated protein Cas5b [Candidatus Hydrothermia bacterium]|jgi:CRISPR-associated protein Cas5t